MHISIHIYIYTQRSIRTSIRTYYARSQSELSDSTYEWNINVYPHKCYIAFLLTIHNGNLHTLSYLLFHFILFYFFLLRRTSSTFILVFFLFDLFCFVLFCSVVTSFQNYIYLVESVLCVCMPNTYTIALSIRSFDWKMCLADVANFVHSIW